jgi:hypothetical protein
VNKVPGVCSSRKLEKFVFPKTPLRRSSVCDDLAIREGKKGSHVRQLITQEYMVALFHCGVTTEDTLVGRR